MPSTRVPQSESETLSSPLENPAGLDRFGQGSSCCLTRKEDNDSDWVDCPSDALSEQLDHQFLAVLQIIAETLDDRSDR